MGCFNAFRHCRVYFKKSEWHNFYFCVFQEDHTVILGEIMRDLQLTLTGVSVYTVGHVGHTEDLPVSSTLCSLYG